MPQIKSEGIILRSVNWKEQSKIVTMFTDNAGLQSIIDRGGRSLKSKRGRLLTFARMEIGYFKSEKSGVGYLSEVEPLEIFLLEKEGNLGRLTFGSAALELLADLLPESEPQERLYQLTLDFLRLIDKVEKKSILPLFISFFLKLLSYLGYRPNFAGCTGCGTEADKTAGLNSDNKLRFLFSPERGGLVCSACQKAGEYYIKLRAERLDKIYSLQTASLTEAAGIKIIMQEAEGILDLLTRFLKYQTDCRELKSLKFFEKLKKTTLKI